MVKFPRLFTITTNQEATIQDMWMPSTNGGRWNFSWRRQLFVWENNLLVELEGILDGFVWRGGDDSWRWKLEEDGIFSVKSLYVKLEGRGLREEICPEDDRRVFRQIWKSGAPSKVAAFVWKALLDRIPTRVNLEIRNCLPTDIGNNCLWCVEASETTNHLFLHCDMARNVWLNLMLWLDLPFVMPPNLFIHWECWSGGPCNKKVRKGLRMIWEATIWVMWRRRNGGIFNNEIVTWDVLVEEVKVLSWRWVLERFNAPACLFYEWCWNPRACLNR